MWWLVPDIQPRQAASEQTMTIAAYGPRHIFQAIKSGNTDLIVVGDSQSTYSADRGQEGLMRHLQPREWCGRVWPAAPESAESGTRTLGPVAPGSGGSIAMETATSDTDAQSKWSPRNYYEITFSGDFGNSSRMMSSLHAYDLASGDYKGVDPFIGERLVGWSIHRASNATEKIINGRYRNGFYVGTVLQGSLVNTDIGTGLGMEAGVKNYLAAGDYASGDAGDENLEFRVTGGAGGDETGDYIQFAGSVVHRVNADNSRANGLVLGACARSGMDASEWNTNAAQAVWQRWFGATDTGADQTVIMVMLGHNTETAGTFADNLDTLLTRLYAAFVADRGVAPMFLLVAPWESDQVEQMTSGRNDTIKGYTGSGTPIGDVSVVSLWEAFGAADPGMVGLHPGDNTELALIYGELWDQINYGPAKDGRRVRPRDIYRKR
tara:strand:+ start:98 stop:1405 length:1308 start_codon:yes stop_codon:yes gene_type:complete